MYALQRIGRPKNIVILRALQLGDLLNAVPAFRALRSALPEARITLVSLPWAADFVKRFHAYLDDFIIFPGFPGFPEQLPDIQQFPSFLNTLQKLNFDLAIQMQGSGSLANSLIRLWGAKRYAGFYTHGVYCPDESRFLLYPEHEHEVWRHLRLMEFLGVPLRGDQLEFPLFEANWKSLQKIKEQFDLYKDYVCIHPGARKPERRWPPEKFAKVADGLSARGYQVVLTGSKEEAELTAAVAHEMKAPAINLAGATDLGTVAALISQACLVVSNDTGISHVASAVKAPSLILFAVSDSDRWGPLNRDLHRVIEDSLNVPWSHVLEQAIEHLEKTSDITR
jgi:ADP-heptose:LPS heptosyltransferase